MGQFGMEAHAGFWAEFQRYFQSWRVHGGNVPSDDFDIGVTAEAEVPRAQPGVCTQIRSHESPESHEEDRG